MRIISRHTLFFHTFAFDMEFMETNQDILFDRNSVEFVTVAAEYCAFLEGTASLSRPKFVDTTLKLLPLLYLKALLIPRCEIIGFEEPESYVTEEIYEGMRLHLARLMGEKDDYLEVFTPDMNYSEGPLTKSVSEDLSDIYQALKDFIFVFKLGVRESMHDSLALCRERFEEYWGQTLVNTLRALHEAKYQNPESAEEDESGHEPDTCGDPDCGCHSS